MTNDERRLLAAINRWRREDHEAHGKYFPPSLTNGYEPADGSARVDVPWWTDAQGWRDDEEVRVRRPDHLGRFPAWPRTYRVRSVTEGVDLLVALRILPARFSSAWRDGFAAGADSMAAAIGPRLAPKLAVAIREEISAVRV